MLPQNISSEYLWLQFQFHEPYHIHVLTKFKALQIYDIGTCRLKCWPFCHLANSLPLQTSCDALLHSSFTRPFQDMQKLQSWQTIGTLQDHLPHSEYSLQRPLRRSQHLNFSQFNAHPPRYLPGPFPQLQCECCSKYCCQRSQYGCSYLQSSIHSPTKRGS